VDVEALDPVAEVALLVGVDSGPPLLPRDAHDPPAQALDGSELRLRGVVRDDDRRGDAELAGHPRDALGHVPRAGRDEPDAERLRGRAEDGVRGAAQLERGDRLEVLEFQPDLGRRIDA
jgi:hypothetical protein